MIAAVIVARGHAKPDLAADFDAEHIGFDQRAAVYAARVETREHGG